MSLRTFRLHGLVAPAAVAGLLLGGASASQAQILFNYTSTLTPASVTNNGVTIGVAPPSADTNDNGQNLGTAVRAGGFRVSSAPAGPGYTPFVGSYNDAFDITDVASGNSGTINVTVDLTTATNNTQVLPGSTTVTLVPTVSSITLGGNTYYVSLNKFDEVAPEGSNQFGSFSFRVQTLAPVGSVPEPGSVAMLVGVGVSGSLLALRRRRTR